MPRFELVFALIVVMIWTAVQQFGAIPLFMGQASRIKHAARGRSTRTRERMHWDGAGHRVNGLHTPAMQLVNELRQERLAHFALAA